MCPFCGKQSYKKRGYFHRNCSRTRKIQRFFCNACLRSFSTQSRELTYKEVKPHTTQPVFRLITAGLSQRKTGELLGIDRKTVAKKIKRLGPAARLQYEDKGASTRQRPPRTRDETVVVFDEMETFEHTKCKPLAITIAVEKKTRRIISCQVASMPAKGHLAAISRRKYGFRKDDRRQALSHVLKEVKEQYLDLAVIQSDECPRYPKAVKKHLPGIKHETFKGRRGCVVGQGELKRGGKDPLFSLNHSCAMVRDNIKTLSRRTWCTVKKPEVLQHLLDMYVVYHNSRIDGIKRLAVIRKESEIQ